MSEQVDEPLSVSELTWRIKGALEAEFDAVCVVGEISNLVRAGSGHVYLTLKDEDAQIRAVLWKRAASRLRFELHDGLQVVVRGPIEVYAGRGTYQLVIQELLPLGLGPLELAFRQLYEKLAAQGLFAPARKRPLPRFPRRIALITSPQGAAVRDMLQVISRRWRAADVVIVPVAVQGATAAAQIAAALRSVHLIPLVDVVITGRGGGSLEDLWAFNEEVVARAIFDCQVPVICAVGHEIDVTIADFVADRRALTPSEAGELVVPHSGDVLLELQRCQQRLIDALKGRADRARQRLNELSRRHVIVHPEVLVESRRAALAELYARLERAIQHRFERDRERVRGLAGTLSALSPLHVLDRGYSVTRLRAAGQILIDARHVTAGDELETQLARGRLISRVERVEAAMQPGDDQPLATQAPENVSGTVSGTFL